MIKFILKKLRRIHAFAGYHIKYLLYFGAEIFILLSILVFIDLISHKHNYIFDLTPTQNFSLSEQSKKVFRALKKDVMITVFYEKGKRTEYDKLLRLCSYESSNIGFAIINLDKNPARAKKYGISTYGEAIVECGNRKKKLNVFNEERITNAVLCVTQNSEKVIYFLKGHGEKELFDFSNKKDYSLFKRTLELENYIVKSLSLLRETQVPSDASLLVICGPKKELLTHEIKNLSLFLQGGGKLLAMIDPFTVPELVAFLKGYGIILGDNVIVDKGSQLIGKDYFTPVAPLYYQRHPITNGFNAGTVYHFARSVDFNAAFMDSVSGIVLVKTDPGSWAETDKNSIDQGHVLFQKGEDKDGPIGIAVFVKPLDHINKWSICVFGDSDFINDYYFNILGNRDLVLNVVSWLAQEEDLISIRPKTTRQISVSPIYLTARQGSLIFWSIVVIEPAIILFIGVLIYIRRLKRG